eukprot:3108622-Amphidinium_carterae.1
MGGTGGAERCDLYSNKKGQTPASLTQKLYVTNDSVGEQSEESPSPVSESIEPSSVHRCRVRHQPKQPPMPIRMRSRPCLP